MNQRPSHHDQPLDLASIGMSLPRGLPNGEYTLSDGVVSVVLAQEGGINMIEYLGPRRTAGRRGAFYSNGVWRRERFFDGPVITFHLTIAGRQHAIPFHSLSLCPYGMASRFHIDGKRFDFTLWIRGKAVMIACSGNEAASLTLQVCEKFLSHHNTDSPWETPYFDEAIHGLRYNLARQFITAEAGKPAPTEWRHEACSIICGLEPVGCERADEQARLTALLRPGAPARFAIVFGEDIHTTAALCDQARRQWPAWARQQFDRYTEAAKRVPRLEMDADSELADIIRLSPLFIHSMLHEKNEQELGLRASTRGYGVWNAWDGQWAFKVLNLCDSGGVARRVLNFQLGARGLNGAVNPTVAHDFGPTFDHNLHSPTHDRQLGDGWTIMHDAWGIEALHEYYFNTHDRATLERHYPGVRDAIHTIHGNAGPTGLVESCFGGADYSAQVNRPQFPNPDDTRTLSSRLSGVEDHALLYSACQQGAELAAVMADDATLDACLSLADRLEQNFMRHFYDDQQGFFIDCVWPKHDPTCRNPTLRLTEMMAVVGYGKLLSMDQWDRLAQTILTRFTHPTLGLRELPVGQAMNLPKLNGWEKWVQNATRDLLRFARIAGSEPLMAILLEQGRAHFRRERVIKETFLNEQATQFTTPQACMTAASCWQAMTTACWWLGILEAVAGLRTCRGQLEHIPGDAGRDSGDIRLSNLHHQGRQWDIRVTGRGRWIKSLTINGVARPATYQLIPEGDSLLQQVVIDKTTQAPAHPVILSAGVGVANVSLAEPHRLDATLTTPGYCQVWFYAPGRPAAVRVDGLDMPFRWSEPQRMGTAAVRRSAAELSIRL